MRNYLILSLLLFTFYPSYALDLQLSCSGTGSNLAQEISHAEIKEKNDKTKITSSTFTTRDFRTVIQYRVAGYSAKISLPEALLPIHSDTEIEWRDVENLSITNNYITGVVNINWLEEGKIKINRTTGEMQYEAISQNFIGDCKKEDNSTLNKLF